MALKNKMVKTKYVGIYSLLNSNTTTSYYAVVFRKMRQYGTKNMTKLYGCKTAKSAFEKLIEIYSMIDRGEDPFNVRSDKLDTLFYSYNSTRKDPYKTTTKFQYDKWVKDFIGHKQISKITVEDVEKIMVNVTNNGVKESTQLAIKNLLMPIFIKEFENERLTRNILKRIKIVSTRNKVVLNSTLDDIKLTVNKVYNVINDVTINKGRSRALFLLSIMTARRIGELCELKYSDIDFKKKLITPRAETTKTKKDGGVIYSYPIPDEVIELLDVNGNDNDLVFSYHKDAYGKQYREMIANNKLADSYRISPHVNRHFFISIMTEYFDKDFVDEVALSHSLTNSTFVTYLTYSDTKIFELYSKYWTILKDEETN